MRLQDMPTESDETLGYGGHSSHPEEMATAVLQRFSHLVVGVTDLDRSEAWYRDVLGLDLLGRNLVNEKEPHSVLQMNTGQLIILVANDELRTAEGRSGVHHGFMLTPNQYRRVYERMIDMGLPVSDDREAFRAGGQYSVDIQDPDGHRYQIQCYGPEGKQLMPGAGLVDCGPTAKYRVGDVRPFKAGNFHLVRLEEGFLAVSRWCTHFNGLVVYQKAHWHFFCPFHYATYDRRGIPAPFAENMAQGPLRLHPVSFSPEGHVLVDTDQALDRSGYDPAQAVPAAANSSQLSAISGQQSAIDAAVTL